MKAIVILISTVVLIIFLLSPTLAVDTRGPVRQLTLQKLKAAEYYVDGQKIKLINGTCKEGSMEEGNALFVDLRDVAFGELNGDGKDDAAVILGNSAGGSGIFIELAAVVNKNGHPNHVASVALGDRVIVKSLLIKSGEIIIHMLTHGSKDAMCCPTQKTVVKYLLEGRELWHCDSSASIAHSSFYRG